MNPGRPTFGGALHEARSQSHDARSTVSGQTLEHWLGAGDEPDSVLLKDELIYPASGVHAYERARLTDPDG